MEKSKEQLHIMWQDAHRALEASLEVQMHQEQTIQIVMAEREEAFDALRALLSNVKPHARWGSTMLIDASIVKEISQEYSGLFVLQPGDYGIHHEEGDVGQYQLDVIALAMKHGWDGLHKDSTGTFALVNQGLTDDYFTAIRWLRANTLVPEGYSLGWWENMFGIWRTNTQEEMA